MTTKERGVGVTREKGTCSYCEHDKSAHKEEGGFYDVRGFLGECDVVGCPCERYQ